MSPSGSYKAINLSLIIGSVIGCLIIIIIIIIYCACYFQCCCFRRYNQPLQPQNTAIIIDTNNSYTPVNYGYPIVDYSKSYNLQPSAPPAYYPYQASQPSAPPANYYNNVI
jgi:hypothetical protein